MILVFGGTTEGRIAAGVLEEAGQAFFYSTATGQQPVALSHGTAISGRMSAGDIIAFSEERGIKLIIDAGHPFALKLHEEVAKASETLCLPVVRYERLYKDFGDESITWCDDYQDASEKIARSGADLLLAFTGANSIEHLNHLEAKGIRCLFRILDRPESRQIAREHGMKDENLLFLSHESYGRQMKRAMEKAAAFRPRRIAILMKESGESGGFSEKFRAAREQALDIYILRRWPVSEKFLTVDGPLGLRLMVERLLPEFFPLHSGITTGTCATAAAVGSLLRLMGRRAERVPVRLPGGETIMVDVEQHEGYTCTIKHAGDDPDVTDGLEIRAEVGYLPEGEGGIRIEGGEGVGRITVAGFDYPIGEAAINKVPREMISRNLRLHTPKGLEVKISVPDGERVASKTFNPRLGIEGGISIIGVSGIVKPFSEESFIASIGKCLKVAKGTGRDMVVINSGAKSERYVRHMFPALPPQSFVEYGNYIGQTISMASEEGFREVVLAMMLGKAVKLAAGQLDTHSRRATMDRALVMEMVERAIAACHYPHHSSIMEAAQNLKLARELWDIIPGPSLAAFAGEVVRRCHEACDPLISNGTLTIILIDNNGKTYT